MVVANLPPLQQAQFTQPRNRGVWESNNLDLDTLARSLDVPKEAMLGDDLKSVPDVWAQFQIVQDAIESPGHPLHEIVRGQWRALLSVLALTAQYQASYEIEILPFELGAPGQRGASRFRSALQRLLPKSTLADGQGWEKLGLLHVRAKVGGGRFGSVGDGQLLGVLNPATLAAPGKPSTSLRVAGVPWLASGLVDPTSPAIADPANENGLRRRDYAVLADYLTELFEEVRRGQSDAPQAASAILRELRDYRSACVELAGIDPPQTETVFARPANFLPPLLQALQRPRVAKVAIRESDCLLKFRDDLQPSQLPFKGVILVDEAIRTSLRMSAHDIHVWKQFTLSDALSAPVFKTICEEAQRDGYLVVRPQDFFTDELVVLEDGAEIAGHRLDGGFRNTVMPFSPLALLLMKPGEIDERSNLSMVGGKERHASLTLTFSGSLVSHAVTKVFEETPAKPGHGLLVLDQTRPMGLAVWPDFHHPSWRWNFLRFQHDPRSSDLLTRFPTSGRLLSAELMSRDVGNLRAEAAGAFFDANRCRAHVEGLRERVTPEDSNAEVARLRYNQRDGNVQELQVSKIGFEAICLSRRRSATEAARPSGMILIGRKSTPQAAGGAVVALDFGTTNTIAFTLGPNDHAAKQVVFKDRVVFPIHSPSSDAQDRDIVKWAFLDFLPPAENTTPLPTVAKLPSIDVDGDPGLEHVQSQADDRMLFSSVVFFLPSRDPSRAPLARDSDAKNLSSNKDRLRFDLKWDDNEVTRKISRRYLRQFAMMVGAEMLADGLDPRSSEWRVSYPEALPNVELYLESFTHSLNLVFGDRPDGQPQRVQDYTEAGASAAYFLDAGGAKGQFVIVLDIGGGTTDVAIWNQDQLKWRGSVKLAGGDFFTSYLYNNPEVLSEGLKLPDMATIIAGKPNRQIVELFFHDRRFSPALDQHYGDIAQGVGAGLRISAMTTLAGVLHYVGFVTRKLIADGDIAVQDLEGMSVALGGRGSEIFRRFHKAARNKASPLERVLGVFASAAGLEMTELRPTITMTAAAKSEVVLGMMSQGDVLNRVARSQAQSHWLPMAERVRMRKGKEVVEVDPQTQADDVALFELDGRPALTELSAFLDVLNEVAGIGIDLDGDGGSGRDWIADRAAKHFRTDLGKAKLAIEARQQGARAVDVKGQTLEPFFVTGLRALVELLTQDEATRRRHVKVHER